MKTPALLKFCFLTLAKKTWLLLTVLDWENPLSLAPHLNHACMLKVSLANSNQRTSILIKAKLLKDSDHFKQIFVRPSYTLVERIHIRSLFNTLQSQQEETGVNHFIDRREPVNLWTVKRKDLPKVPSVNGGFTASASNCPTKGN